MGAYPTINLNDLVPAAPTDGLNIKFQSVQSVNDPNILNVSGAIVGPGGTNFLRADGVWAAPPGGGGSIPSGSNVVIAAPRTGVQTGYTT